MGTTQNEHTGANDLPTSTMLFKALTIGVLAAASQAARLPEVVWPSECGGLIAGDEHQEYHGWSVDNNADGSRVVIGAPYADPAGSSSGRVKVYECTGGAWVMMGSPIAGETSGDHFGKDVSISDDGTRISVSTSRANNYYGQVKVYEYKDGEWSMMGNEIQFHGQSSGFGETAQLSGDGNVVVVGLPYYTAVSYKTNIGAVAVYKWDAAASRWNQWGNTLYGQTSRAAEYFGKSVAISADGSRIAVGANGASPISGGGNSNGCITSFHMLNGGTAWVQYGQSVYGTNLFERLGTSVALDSTGENFITGGTKDSNSNDGIAKIYKLDGNTWVQRGNTISGWSGVQLGMHDVDISGDGSRIIFGYPQWNSAYGLAHVYERNPDSNTWQSINTGGFRGDAAGEQFGFALTISRDGFSVAVAGRGASGQTGEVTTNKDPAAPTPSPTAAPTAEPTAEPTSPGIAASQLSASHLADTWAVGQDGDTVYKCYSGMCYSNERSDRTVWKRLDGDFPVLQESVLITSDGEWQFTDEKARFKYGGGAHSWPWSCDCAE